MNERIFGSSSTIRMRPGCGIVTHQPCQVSYRWSMWPYPGSTVRRLGRLICYSTDTRTIAILCRGSVKAWPWVWLPASARGARVGFCCISGWFCAAQPLGRRSRAVIRLAPTWLRSFSGDAPQRSTRGHDHVKAHAHLLQLRHTNDCNPWPCRVLRSLRGSQADKEHPSAVERPLVRTLAGGGRRGAL